MKVKNIVKVMNMHALIRVEATKKEAERYILLENEVNNMIDNIVNNRNFKLDKKLISSDKNKPALNIFIGSDRGFCGSYNFQINKAISNEGNSEKIIIGKKVMRNYENVILSIKKDDFDLYIDKIIDKIYDSIFNKENSEINITYFRYNKVGDLKLVKKRLFPFDMKLDNNNEYTEDFLYEGNITNLLLDLIVLYIKYEIILANTNSKASENIMRQENTSDSLKKIEEREEVLKIETRKIKKKKEFEKVLSNFTKLKID